MAIDLAKMREKLEAVKNRGGKSAFWKPPEGESTIRIIPTSDGDPFKEYWFHYNLGNNPGFLSPKKNFGEEDPLDDFVRNLWREKTDESIKLAKNLCARQRFFAPILVRGEEEKGAQVWGFGKMAYQQLLELVLNPDYGDITDTDDGTDLIIKYEKPAGASFPKTTITPRRRTGPLCDEAVGGSEECAKLLESIPEFGTLFERKTPEQVQVMLNEFLDGESASDQDEVVKYNDASATVDDAFSDLMNA